MLVRQGPLPGSRGLPGTAPSAPAATAARAMVGMKSGVAAAGRPLPAGLLDAVRGVDDDGAAEALHERDASGRRRRGCCSRRSSPARSAGCWSLPRPSGPCPRRCRISAGDMNWPFLDVDRLARVRGGRQIRSVWRQRKAGIWRTSRTAAARPTCQVSWTSERTGTPTSSLTARRMSRPVSRPGAAEGVDRGAVGLVEGGLEDEGQCRAARRSPSSRRARARAWRRLSMTQGPAMRKSPAGPPSETPGR